MAIDQTRQHGCPAEVDDAGAVRNLDAGRRTDLGDAVALDQDHLVAQIGARLGIEQPARPDGYALGWRRLHVEL